MSFEDVRGMAYTASIVLLSLWLALVSISLSNWWV
jgi:hypothetical protein